MSGDILPIPRNRADHLAPHRFPRGQSGNPGGRPKNRESLTATLRRVLDGDELLGETVPEGMSVGEFLVHRLVIEAMRGNPTAIREVFSRIDGKAPEVDEVSTLSDDELLQRIEALARGSDAAGPGGAGDPEADAGTATDDEPGDVEAEAPPEGAPPEPAEGEG